MCISKEVPCCYKFNSLCFLPSSALCYPNIFLGTFFQRHTCNLSLFLKGSKHVLHSQKASSKTNVT
jgi:hypothetical protein